MRLCGSASGIETGFYEHEGHLCLYLSADFCAEHEWGIKGIQEEFGIKEPKDRTRLAGWMASLVPDFAYEEKDKKAALIYVPYDLPGSALGCAKRMGMSTHVRPIDGAWSHRDFGVVVEGEDNVAKLRRIRDAIEEKRVAIFLGGPSENPFSRMGLSIVALAPDKDVAPCEKS